MRRAIDDEFYSSGHDMRGVNKGFGGLYNHRGEMNKPGVSLAKYKEPVSNYLLYSWRQTADPVKAIMISTGETKKALDVQSLAV